MVNFDKVSHSMSLLRKAEKLALMLNQQDGFWLAFSGGKDSQAIMELAKMSGVKFHAYYNVTTIDPPANVRFIREQYPEVTFIHPKETFLQLIQRKNMLPNGMIRFCCTAFKENIGKGNAVITGVRAEESAKRRMNGREVSKQVSGSKNTKARERELARDKDGLKELDRMEEVAFSCVHGNDKFMILPILSWTESEIWEFLEWRQVPRNPIYQYATRCSCLFCPLKNQNAIYQDVKLYPGYYRNLLLTIAKMMNNGAFRNIVEKYQPTPQEIFDWWASKQKAEVFFENLRKLK